MIWFGIWDLALSADLVIVQQSTRMTIRKSEGLCRSSRAKIDKG
jgi:hypothetical protein